MNDDTPINPFPGLRSFKTEERYLFFGREGQSEAILSRLREHRFVALVGASGSGKSSLINAGLLPYLYGGFLANAGSSWRVAICRPGNDPIGNLAAVLCRPEVLGDSNSTAAQQADEALLMEVTLRGSSMGLIDAVQLARLPQNEQVVIVVDQFEELFRFAGVAGGSARGEDATTFVNLLLEAQSRPNLPIYIVLALRSDYIGDCARFRGLPEAIMSAMYLIPRMARDQRRQAIEGPVRVGGGTIALRLVNRLLNDVGDNPDQLPSLQHALMRTWEYWQTNRAGEGPIDLDDYNAIGGIAKALSIHADDTLSKLPEDESRAIARLAFQCLTGKDISSREARHPATIETIAAVAKIDAKAAIKIINHFRDPERAFLTPVWGVDIAENSVIDISHESLIRGWDRLRNWVVEEAESAKTYLRLAEAAALRAEGKTGLWRDPELQLALNWYNEATPNEAWSNRYDAGFKQTMGFLDESRRQRDAQRQAAEEQRRRTLVLQRRVAISAVGVAMVIGLLAIVAGHQWLQAKDALLATRRTQDLYLASLAEQWTKAGNAGAALPLALEIASIPSESSGRVYPQAELQIENAIRHLHERLVLSAGTEPVLSAEFSPDGSRIVTASADGVARIWDAQTGKHIDQFTTDEKHSINDASFSPDGRLIVTASDDNIVRVWDLAAGKYAANEFQGRTAAFSPDGKRLVTLSTNGTACVWQVQTGMRICTADEAADELRSAAFSPDGVGIAAGAANGVVHVWNANVEPLKETMTMRHGAEVTSVAYSQDGKHIITASLDKTAAVWNAETGEKVGSIVVGAGVGSAAISRDQRRIVTASQDNIARLWDAVTGDPIGEPFRTGIEPQKIERFRAAFSPDGRRIVTASEDGTARVWDVDLPTDARIYKHAKGVRSARFDSGGARIVTASDDGRIRIWKAGESSSPILDLVDVPARSIGLRDASFSFDGKYVVTASADGAARIRDAGTGQQLGEPFKAEDGQINAAVFSPDGGQIATAYENGYAWIWDVSTRKPVKLAADAKGARSVVFSPDGRQVLTAHRDGSARTWNATGEPLAQTPGSDVPLRDAAYSPDGKSIVTAARDGSMRIWDGRTLERTNKAFSVEPILYSVTFSPDGSRLLTASQDGTARILDAQTGDLIGGPFASGGEAWGAAFADNGKYVAVASSDGVLKVWPVVENTKTLIEYARGVAPRCLTDTERNDISFLSAKHPAWCDQKWPFRSK